jgi:hypothetical protein
MRKIQTIIVIVGLLFSLTASAENRQVNKIEPLPQDLEIQLALSALPPHLRDNTTVYVLNPDKGFEVARKGTNGFSTRFPLITQASRRRCRSSLTRQRCKPRVLLLEN